MWVLDERVVSFFLPPCTLEEKKSFKKELGLISDPLALVSRPWVLGSDQNNTGSTFTVAAVTKDWVMACQMEKAWVSEKPFLVGDSNVFTEGKPMPKLVCFFE